MSRFRLADMVKPEVIAEFDQYRSRTLENFRNMSAEGQGRPPMVLDTYLTSLFEIVSEMEQSGKIHVSTIGALAKLGLIVALSDAVERDNEAEQSDLNG